MAKSKQIKPSPPIGAHYITVDAWTLKCLYNRSDYAKRITGALFVELHRQPSKWRNGSRSVQAYYGPMETRELMVTLQWFENERLEILRSGQKDPKQIYRRGMDFHHHGGNSLWQQFRREPQAFLGEGHMTTAKGRLVLRIQLSYGWWRTFKCSQLGPVEAASQVILSAALRRISGPAALGFLRAYNS